MENLYEKIESYLLGELEGPELQAFEKAIQSDNSLQKSVAQHREMMQRLDALRLRGKVKTALSSPAAEKASLNKRGIWALLALLLILSAAIAFYIHYATPENPKPTGTLPQNAPSQPANNAPVQTPAPDSKTPIPIAKAPEDHSRLMALAQTFHQMPSESMIRDAGEPTAPQTATQKAVEAFDHINYKLVTEILKSDTQVKDDELAQFLRANARFQLGQFGGAAADFNVLRNHSFQFKHEARWEYLLCQLALGKTAEAKSLLDAMVADKDFPFHAKAVELKARIGKDF